MREKAAAENMVYNDAQATVRCEMIFLGTMALSPAKYCCIDQIMIPTPKTTSTAITRPEPQEYCCPPQVRARSRQMTDGMKVAVPIGSNLATIWSSVLSLNRSGSLLLTG